MTLRRLKLAAAIVAVPLAVWLIYLLSFALWQGLKPAVAVRYAIAPTPGGGVAVRFETRENEGFWVSELRPLGGGVREWDGYGDYSPEPAWGDSSGSLHTYAAAAAQPVAPADRWLTLAEDEPRVLFVLTDADGARRAFTVANLPETGNLPELTGTAEEIDRQIAERQAMLGAWFDARRPLVE